MDVKVHEGDLYRVLRVCGREFVLRYGYYEQRERESRYGEPIPIYPNFRASPQYTEDGYPFVTAMQDACERYEGDDCEACCHTCRYYEDGEEFLGICRHNERRQCAATEYMVTNKQPNHSTEERNV